VSSIPARAYLYHGHRGLCRDIVCSSCDSKPESLELYCALDFEPATIEQHGEDTGRREWVRQGDNGADVFGRVYAVTCDLCGEEIEEDVSS